GNRLRSTDYGLTEALACNCSIDDLAAKSFSCNCLTSSCSFSIKNVSSEAFRSKRTLDSPKRQTLVHRTVSDRNLRAGPSKGPFFLKIPTKSFHTSSIRSATNDSISIRSCPRLIAQFANTLPQSG